MTEEHRSAAEIERDIEHDREALTENIQGIQDKFSFDSIVLQVGDQLREHGSDISRVMARSVKENPMACALTSVGLAWMIFGNGRGEQATRDGAAYGERSVNRSVSHRAKSPSASLRASETPAWAQDQPRSHGFERDSHSDRNADQSSSSGLVDQAKEWGERIAHGTENLSETARERVVGARSKAMEAKRKLTREAERAADKASDWFEQQPLITGALAFAVGAALGSALPRTELEDGAVGAQSDALFAEAERLFQDEKAHAERILGAAAKEVKAIVDEGTESSNPNKAQDEGTPEDQSRIPGSGNASPHAQTTGSSTMSPSAQTPDLRRS